jgi:ribonuclease VapC
VTGIVVDTSAIMAVLLGEPDRTTFHEILLATAPIMSTATRVELSCTALSRFGPERLPLVDDLLGSYEIRFEPVDDAQMKAALAAAAVYGRGRRAAPAVLNYGDLFSYALAKTRNMPLLYKGEDFAATDIVSALSIVRTAINGASES